MKGVVEFDRLERERKERRELGEHNDANDEQAITPAELTAVGSGSRSTVPPLGADDHGSDEEYEEVEVTDDDGEESRNPYKRQRTEEKGQDQPIEFNEEDIAYQLAAMGQDYGLDPGEYGVDPEDQWEEGAEGLPLTEEDSQALFRDLLEDYHVNPYGTWERIIEEGHIIGDDRYTVLPNMKARKEAFSSWSRDKIALLKEQREKAEKKDPRIPYMAFLQKNATPKLYWPEFRRKYKKEPEMRDTKLADRDRERWYREHISRLKLPQSTLKSDLSALLKSLPLSVLNRSSLLGALPPQLLTDIRYISLPPAIRDPLIETYISTLPPAPHVSGLSAAAEEEAATQRAERERREKALAERERRVKEEKRRQERELAIGKGRLREEERELQKAMNVSKEGLRAQLGAVTGGDKEQEGQQYGGNDA